MFNFIANRSTSWETLRITKLKSQTGDQNYTHILETIHFFTLETENNPLHFEGWHKFDIMSQISAMRTCKLTLTNKIKIILFRFGLFVGMYFNVFFFSVADFSFFWLRSQFFGNFTVSTEVFSSFHALSNNFEHLFHKPESLVITPFFHYHPHPIFSQCMHFITVWVSCFKVP